MERLRQYKKTMRFNQDTSREARLKRAQIARQQARDMKAALRREQDDKPTPTPSAADRLQQAAIHVMNLQLNAMNTPDDASVNEVLQAANVALHDSDMINDALAETKDNDATAVLVLMSVTDILDVFSSALVVRLLLSNPLLIEVVERGIVSGDADFMEESTWLLSVMARVPSHGEALAPMVVSVFTRLQYLMGEARGTPQVAGLIPIATAAACILRYSFAWQQALGPGVYPKCLEFLMGLFAVDLAPLSEEPSLPFLQLDNLYTGLGQMCVVAQMCLEQVASKESAVEGFTHMVDVMLWTAQDILKHASTDEDLAPFLYTSLHTPMGCLCAIVTSATTPLPFKEYIKTHNGLSLLNAYCALSKDHAEDVGKIVQCIAEAVTVLTKGMVPLPSEETGHIVMLCRNHTQHMPQFYIAVSNHSDLDVLRTVATEAWVEAAAKDAPEGGMETLHNE